MASLAALPGLCEQLADCVLLLYISASRCPRVCPRALTLVHTAPGGLWRQDDDVPVRAMPGWRGGREPADNAVHRRAGLHPVRRQHVHRHTRQNNVRPDVLGELRAQQSTQRGAPGGAARLGGPRLGGVIASCRIHAFIRHDYLITHAFPPARRCAVSACATKRSSVTPGRRCHALQVNYKSTCQAWPWPGPAHTCIRAHACTHAHKHTHAHAHQTFGMRVGA